MAAKTRSIVSSSAHKSVCFLLYGEGEPQLILNIGMQASLALPIVINGFHVCRIGSPGTERSTSQAYSPAAKISSSAAPSDWLRCKSD
jgi:hypothetical protein